LRSSYGQNSRKTQEEYRNIGHKFPAGKIITPAGSPNRTVEGERKRAAKPISVKGKHTAMTDVAKPRILVVEDDPDLRRILKLQLVSRGFEITEAENGAEGFSAIQEELPDCVILDLMMPVMDGFGFLKRIRSIMGTKDVPVLILTASEDERNKVRGLQYQADNYMSKPYDLDKLTEVVEKMVAAKGVPQPA
jgi:CheY-like chemotaxis protein